MKIAFLLLSLPVLAVAASCPYVENSDPFEFELPATALSHPLKDLPLKFVGFAPVVTRQELPFGSAPKVTIQRYSTRPNIEYDSEQGMVVIAPAGCGSNEASACMQPPRNGRMLPVATALALALAPRSAVAAGVAIAAATLPFTKAYDEHRFLEECTPSVKVVVQAPAAYMGAVETCLAEVSEVGHCPLPFPTFETCDEPSPVCKVAVVGAGAGGLYTALRMVDEGKVEGSEVCVFEMTERVGGRLFSLRGLGPDGDLTVDAGGYRTWPEYTPTLHALITEYLNITMDCYDPSEVPCQKFNIVDDKGNKAGFATFVEEMMTRLIDAGACFYPYHELVSLSLPEDEAPEATQRSAGISATELRFANGVTATATYTTILNLPQRPLLKVLRNSELPVVDTGTLDALHSVQTVIASKLYMYYPKGQVFWRKLGMTSGDFEMDGDARDMLLAGRFHDGHVVCEDEDDLDTCHGFLLAVYANDLSGNKAQFFRRYQRERPEPVTIMSNSDLESAQFLRHAHSRMVEFVEYESTGFNYTGSQLDAAMRGVNPPEFAVLSTWNVAVPWAGGAWHAWTDLDNVNAAMKPLVHANIFVVNEAYSLLHGWAEGSIKLADSILEDYFSIERPWTVPVVELVQIVQQTNSRECTVEDTGTSSAAETEDDSGGGGGNPALCFMEDAIVTMADGTFKKISDVETGEFVSTGTGFGKGLVTETLIHPVNSNVAVAVMETDVGNLKGTPDHPILQDGEWRELQEVGTTQPILVQDTFVDALYNLEIDGDAVGDSSHSYVVNGVIASGLGDSIELNTQFPRQRVWKEQ